MPLVADASSTHHLGIAEALDDRIAVHIVVVGVIRNAMAGAAPTARVADRSDVLDGVVAEVVVLGR